MVATVSRTVARMLASVALLIAPLTYAASPGLLPAPALDIPAAQSQEPQSAVFAGGCFWGVEAVFRHTKGVVSAVSGYAGGTAGTADYEKVSSGTTGHAEAVKVTYDPKQVSYGQLLRIFFSVAHDPTQVDRQGPDYGTQYRSVIFYTSDEQKRVARSYIDQLGRAKAFARPIATQVTPLPAFYVAEAYHQNYVALHPNQLYIVFNDLPKLASLKERFPDWYQR